ncbi:MAG TPA: DUF2493 domain-containing protein [Marinobacter sp.]|uniref:YspA cpYpsA-related SLOG domain-containing protein n=1 Tax=marine sediment metagenome TaxID=412755 RepID=A0A0F9C3G0_9ZZZZ|nr:DUF2493 domain-containing protein [Marinobacter sp.]
MRVLVYGGRDFTRTTTAYRALDALHKKIGIDVVIEGDARGADRIAGFWARKNQIENRKFPIKQIEWNLYGAAAGPIRNQKMLDEGKPEYAVEFPGGRGTADMATRLEKAGIEIYRPLGDA